MGTIKYHFSNNKSYTERFFSSIEELYKEMILEKLSRTILSSRKDFRMFFKEIYIDIIAFRAILGVDNGRSNN